MTDFRQEAKMKILAKYIFGFSILSLLSISNFNTSANSEVRVRCIDTQHEYSINLKPSIPKVVVSRRWDDTIL